MLLTNHALTGVWLGSVIDEPILAFPAGVISHLLLDSTPHANWTPGPFIKRNRPKDGGSLNSFRTPKGFLMGSLDFGCALTILAVGLYIMPERRIQVAAGWFGATGPDLLYLPEIFFKKRLLPKFKAFHSHVQWSESPYGIPTEILWATLMLHLLHLV